MFSIKNDGDLLTECGYLKNDKKICIKSLKLFN